jgi:hypothetical protein
LSWASAVDLASSVAYELSGRIWQAPASEPAWEYRVWYWDGAWCIRVHRPGPESQLRFWETAAVDVRRLTLSGRK